ncbi:HNH endonuclease signature motif containing protein [Streptomyces sp. NPDC058067]|uniref:HNH endonuclease signature motif containing protein n=1 Tax=Streptomyces sp. NPDC058067 TaxID=3346324 RepID=UPI0036E5E3B4
MGAPLKPPFENMKPVTLPDGRQHQLTEKQLHRLWGSVEPDEAGCWIWTGRLDHRGYGRFSLRRRILLVYRVTYMLLVGEIPAGLHLDHLCRVHACCNPAHLEPVTCRENILRSPIAPAAINARKTHCQKGHEFTPENTVATPTGRGCLTCQRERGRRRYAEATGRSYTAEVPGHSKQGQRREDPDVCVHGHAFTPENTYIDPRGTARCRTCRTLQDRRQRARQKQAQSTAPKEATR